jgi:hypothetical protein
MDGEAWTYVLHQPGYFQSDGDITYEVPTADETTSTNLVDPMMLCLTTGGLP